MQTPVLFFVEFTIEEYSSTFFVTFRTWELSLQADKKHKKKKSKDKGDCSDKSERRRLKKSRSAKTSSNAQSGLLVPGDVCVSFDEYDSF